MKVYLFLYQLLRQIIVHHSSSTYLPQNHRLRTINFTRFSHRNRTDRQITLGLPILRQNTAANFLNNTNIIRCC